MSESFMRQFVPRVELSANGNYVAAVLVQVFLGASPVSQKIVYASPLDCMCHAEAMRAATDLADKIHAGLY